MQKLIDHGQQRRRTRDEIKVIKAAIFEILSKRNPQADRQLFYQLICAGVVPKLEREYKSTVIRLCGLMRESGELPWSWLTDGTRWMRKPRSYSSLSEALSLTAVTYRRALWDNQNVYVELWCEKEALASILYEITSKYDVPLMIVKGFPSKAFVHDAAEAIAEREVPAFIYYCGDLDPSGLWIWDGIQRKISRYAPGADVTFERLAVTEAQVVHYGLPMRPTKREGNAHAKGFEGDSVEVDALPVEVLQGLVRSAIERHIDRRQLEITKLAEDSERKWLEKWIK